MNFPFKYWLSGMFLLLLFWGCEDQKASGPKISAVVVSPEKQDLMPGETYQLNALVVDETRASLTDVSITWTSSDETVAIVSDQGLLTALEPGLAIITATAGKMSGTCELMVSDSRRKILSELFTSST